MSANEKQVGGQHYREGGVSLQHWDVVVDHHVGYLEAVGSKYLTRCRKKNGLEDLLKAEHYCEKLLEKIDSGDVVQAEGYVPTEVCEEFARQNNLQPLEAEAIRLLWQWGERTDVEAALRMTQDLVAQNQAQPEQVS